MDQPVADRTQETQHVRKQPVLAWVLVVALFITNVAGFGLYGFTQRQLENAKDAKVVAEKKTADTEKLLTAANTKLSRAAILPKSSEMSPQCNGPNNDQTRVAPVNITPIDGYSIYIVNCVKDLVAGQRNYDKVIGMKVNADGSQKFVFGTGADEPYCISKSQLGDASAQKVSAGTGLPVCKNF